MKVAALFLALVVASLADFQSVFAASSNVAYKSFAYVTANTPHAMTNPVKNRDVTNFASELVGFEISDVMPSFVTGGSPRVLADGDGTDTVLPNDINEQIDNINDCDQITPQWFIYTLAGVFVAFGLLECFAGWRVFQCMVFLTAFALGWALGFFGTTYAARAADNTESYIFWVAVGVGVVLGICFGVALVKWIKIAFFVVGAFAGMMLGLLFNWLCMVYVEGYAIWIVWVWIGAMGLICGAIGAYFGKIIVMLFTAWAGSSLCITGVGAFVSNHDLGPCGSDTIEAKGEEFWAYFAGMVVLSFLGFYTQYKCFNEHENEKYQAVKTQEPVCAKAAL